MSPAARRALGGLAGAAAMIAAVTALSRVLGFGRWLAQAYAFGPGEIGGAYNSANTLPNVLFEVAAGGALAGALIPVLALPVSRGLRKDVDTIVSATLGWTLVVLVPLGGLLAALSGPLAAVWPGGLDQAQRDLVRVLLVVFAPQVPMYGVAVLLYAVLQAHRKFFWPAFAPVLSTVVMLATYLGYAALSGGERDDPGVVGPGPLAFLAWGTTVGVAAMCLPMFVPVHRLGVRLRPTLRFPPGVGRRLAGLAFAGVGSLVAQQAAVLVGLVVANQRGTGGTYSVYLWSQQVYLLPYAVLVVPLATSTFPRLAARAAEHDRAGFAALAATTTRAVLAAGATGAGVLVAVAPAVADVFGHVSRDAAGVGAEMTLAVTLLAPGLAGFALMFHASRALYALERGRTAVLANATGWGAAAVATVVLALLLAPGAASGGGDGPGTLRALALGGTVGMLVGGLAAVLGLRRVAGAAAVAGLLRSTGVLLVGAAGGALVGRWVVDTVGALAGHGIVSALLAGAGGAVVSGAVVVLGLAVADRDTLRGLRPAASRGGGPGVPYHGSP